MKIGITSTGKDLSATVDSRFGRCPYFIIVDSDSMEYECIENEYATAAGGAGIRSAQKVIDKGVQVVITGNIGPNASQTLSTAGVKVITGATGKIKDVIEKYKKGELKEVNTHTTPRHFGKNERDVKNKSNIVHL